MTKPLYKIGDVVVFMNEQGTIVGAECILKEWRYYIKVYSAVCKIKESTIVYKL